MSSKITLLLVALGFAAQSYAAHLSPRLLFTARMDGENNTTVINPDANGIASFFLSEDRTTLEVNISLANLSADAYAIHIHEGQPGTDGPAAYDLTPFLDGNIVRTTITGTTLDDLLPKLLNNTLYVNAHTEMPIGGGEVRGQIKLERDYGFYANLDTIAEVPTPSGSNAIGSGNFIIDQNNDNIFVRVSTSGLTGPITGAHLHRGAEGQTGAPIVDLTPLLISATSMEGSLQIPAGIKDSLKILIDNDLVYFNVHTDANPAGEIRGQAKVSTDLYIDLNMTNDAVVGGATNLFTGYGAGHGYINAAFDQFRYFMAVEVDSLNGAIVDASLYTGAAGEAGTLVKTLSVDAQGKIAGAWNKSDATQPLTDDIIYEMLEGNVYIQINTTGSPTGEVRGQVIRAMREGYVYELDTEQEVPAPSVTGNPLGGGMVSINSRRNNAHYMLAWSGLSGDVTGAHFHKNAPGQTGDPIHDITGVVSNDAAYGYWTATDGFDGSSELAFRQDSVYVNIHTDANAAGEIRGDVSRSYTISSETTNPTSIENINVELKGATVFPNPTADATSLTVDLNEAVALEWSVINMLGETVLSNTSAKAAAHRIDIDMNDMSTGIYLVKVRANQANIATMKLLKR